MSLHMPMSGLTGGVLIGLAADTLLLGNGDIMGASGIVSTVVLAPIDSLKQTSQQWKIVFIASFLSTTAFVFAPMYDPNALATSEATSARQLSTLGYALAGVLVGAGTKLGNGCTSGHGICGLGRLSPRSLASVMTFLSTGIVTTVLVSPQNGTFSFLYKAAEEGGGETRVTSYGILVSLLSLAAAFVAPIYQRRAKLEQASKKDDDGENKDEDNKSKLIPAGISGALFSAGLYVSTMVYQSKVFGFLDVSQMPSGKWDGTLMCVMGGGVLVSFAAYQFLDPFRIVKMTSTCQHPIAMSDKSSFAGIPTSTQIDWKLVSGAVIFGLGWGIGGICPGPGMFLAATGVVPVLQAWWPGFLAGSYVANQIKKRF